ncbi:putative phosphatase [Rubidibacter lacunae KORDI 51-2]|uniref:Putative phosphatase n=1 Tax=Rubidibacter lacunae KORDI 51-2 TaxID=582515 RepID=U5DJW7_9CHRO|nr:HAD family hydrolase [Rubidibacter lacunae]ERN40874.1 putative phosphatase [Rubidibacter lacunae KORDI 51-2]
MRFALPTSAPALLALDFDGVICDGRHEYFQTSWRTYRQLWQPAISQPPEGLQDGFFRLRPIIETGWEMPVLLHVLLQDTPESEIWNDWSALVARALEAAELERSKVARCLDGVRDEWIATNLSEWLDLHRFYPGVAASLQARTRQDDLLVYIITTKEGRFTNQLLARAGVELPRDRVIGKEIRQPKPDTLEKLLATTGTPSDRLWFVEDRLKALEAVTERSNLDGARLFLASWGYTTDAQLERARRSDRLQLLNLEQFAADWADWLPS